MTMLLSTVFLIVGFFFTPVGAIAADTNTNCSDVGTTTDGTKPTDCAKRYSNGGTSLVQCDGVVSHSGEIVCNFAALIRQIQYIINWMFAIAVPIAIAMFAYAGFLFMSGIPSKRTQAKAIFATVGTGFLLMLIGWFVIYTVVLWLAKPDQGFTSLLTK
jgi:hypothetical protein